MIWIGELILNSVIFAGFPFHFCANKLEGFQTATQMRCIPFRHHGKGRIMRTARDTIFIDGIVWIG